MRPTRALREKERERERERERAQEKENARAHERERERRARGARYGTVWGARTMSGTACAEMKRTRERVAMVMHAKSSHLMTVAAITM